MSHPALWMLLGVGLMFAAWTLAVIRIIGWARFAHSRDEPKDEQKLTVMKAGKNAAISFVGFWAMWVGAWYWAALCALVITVEMARKTFFKWWGTPEMKEATPAVTATVGGLLVLFVGGSALFWTAFITWRITVLH